jgi:hypothetical protein
MLLEWRFLFRLAGIENVLLLANKAIGTASSEGVNITLTIEKYPNIFFGHTKCGRPTLQKSFFGNRRKLISEKFDTAYPSSLVRHSHFNGSLSSEVWNIGADLYRLSFNGTSGILR